ncbi:hypothetical protein PHLCEN_2v10565 [Hermanssonia centrifuga]|uniref:Uncharacterized protein n=1 Tax=Hermanssonia centrifuga TaxID=98765 RepID=A0A2R6NNN1_9APHY|nr:hypothetical protein PHLCEN_2v10565 [Hermanssonia centrifuga]
MSARSCHTFLRQTGRLRCRRNAVSQRLYSDTASKKPSSHAQFYSEMIPGMVPIALLGSAVYLGLRLLQANLSQERFLDEARARIGELEREVEDLREKQIAVSTPVSGPVKKRGWLW